MDAPLLSVSGLAEPRSRTRWLFALEVGVVGAAVTVGLLLSRSGVELDLLSAEDASSAFAVLSGALAVIAASMWQVLFRLTGDGRFSLGVAAMAVYGLIAVPCTSLGAVGSAGPAIGVVRLTAHALVVLFLLAATLERATGCRPGTRVWLATALVGLVAAATVGFIQPDYARVVSESPPLRWFVVIGWVVAGARTTRIASRLGLVPSVRAGLGVTVLGLAHAFRVISEPAQPPGSPGLTFSALRLVALLCIALGAVGLVRSGLRGLSRNHQARMKNPVASVYVSLLPAEFDRLRLSLATAPGAETSAQGPYDVGHLIRAVVRAARACGMDVHCEIGEQLRADGTEDLLRVVLANLLANCARHAPGCRVTVLAWRTGERVVVRVEDDGPGLLDEIQQAMFEPGVGGADSTGCGLGLYLCRALLLSAGGDLRLHRGNPGGPGCTMQVDLPAAVEADLMADAASAMAQAPAPEWVRESVDQDIGVASFAGSGTGEVLVNVPGPLPGLGQGDRFVRRVSRFDERCSPLRTALPSLLLAVAPVGVLLALGRIPAITASLARPEIATSVALMAVALSVLGAFSYFALGHLGDEPAALWLGGGLGAYGLLVIPMAIVGGNTTTLTAPAGNIRMLAQLILVVMTGVAVVVVRPAQRMTRVVAVWLGPGMVAAAVWLGFRYPATSLAVTDSPVAHYIICGGWLIAAVALILVGASRQARWLRLAGVGHVMIALAHIVRVVTSSPVAPLGPVFPGTRFVGVLILAGAVVPAARRVLLDTDAARRTQLAELNDLKADLQQFEEQQHEVRTAIAAVATATAVLGSDTGEEADATALRTAMSAELSRLNLLLWAGRSTGDGVHVDYEIFPVVRDQVALQRSAGVDIRMDVEPGLQATGNPLVLSQVLTNVLANCGRHAPASPVRIQAMRRGMSVLVRVCDFGPGMPIGVATTAFDLGVRGPDSPGQGFGLHICQRLLAEQSGRISITSRSMAGTGCTVVIELPAPPAINCSPNARSAVSHS